MGVTMEDMVDMVLDTEAMVLDTGATVTTTVRDLLMPNLKLMPDICMADTAMEDMEAMDMVLMAVDTDIALDTMEDMVDMVLDTEDMAVSGDKHSQFSLRAFIQKLPFTNYLFNVFSST